MLQYADHAENRVVFQCYSMLMMLCSVAAAASCCYIPVFALYDVAQSEKISCFGIVLHLIPLPGVI